MIFKPVLVEKILCGQKFVTRRLREFEPPWHACAYEVGKEYALQLGMGRPTIGKIKIVSVEPQLLGDIDDADAVLEGFENRDEFVAYWNYLYQSGFDDERPVWRIGFRVSDVHAMVCTSCYGLGYDPINTDDAADFVYYAQPENERTDA